MLKRSIAILLCLVVIFSLAFSGCTKNDETNTTTTAKKTTTEAQTTTTTIEQVGYTLPLSTDGAVLKLTTYESLGPESLSTILPVWKKYTEETGVKLEWETIARVDYDVTMQTRLAAGSGLADIITVPGLNNAAGRFVEGGLFLPLDELVAKFAPGITKMMGERFDVFNQIRYSDGLLYGLPADTYGLEPYKSANDFYNPVCLNIRLDLLKKIGSDYPTTIDELHDVLLKFKDLEGIIPFGHAGFSGGMSILMNSYGIPATELFYPDEKGVVEYQMIRPEMKEFLTEMNKWYKEGLFDPEGDPSTANANAVAGKYGVMGGNVGTAFINHLQLVNNVPDGIWSILGPLEGPNGDALASGYGFWSGVIVAVTKDCKDPELAIKWLDYTCFTDDGIYNNSFGIKGVDWEYDASGKPVFTTDGQKNIDTVPNYLYLQGAYTAGALPGVMLKQVRQDLYWGALKTVEWGQYMIDTAYKMGEIVTPPFPNMMAVGNEDEIISQYMTDITTYVNESITGFITGTKSLDEFDDYVKTVKDLGIAEIEKVRQAQYDRYMSAQ